MSVTGFFKSTADKSDIIGSTASATGLRNNDSQVAGVIFAGKDSLHDLSNYHQRRVAGIIVYIFKAHVNCMLVVIFQYFQFVACFLEGWLNQ